VSKYQKGTLAHKGLRFVLRKSVVNGFAAAWVHPMAVGPNDEDCTDYDNETFVAAYNRWRDERFPAGERMTMAHLERRSQ